MVQEYTILNLSSRQTFHGIFILLIIKRLTQYGSGIYNIKSFFKINVHGIFILLIIKRLTKYGSGIYNIKSFFKINVSWYFHTINY